MLLHDETARPLEVDCIAGQVGRVAELRKDRDGVDFAAAGNLQGDRPRVVVMPHLEEAKIVDARQRRTLAHGVLCSLNWKGVAAAAAKARKVDAVVEVVVEERRDLTAADASEVKPLREADEVAGEAVAAYVAPLPNPIGVHLLP
jgi:hypothetical protein